MCVPLCTFGILPSQPRLHALRLALPVDLAVPEGNTEERHFLRHCLLDGGSVKTFVCWAPVYTLAHQTLLLCATTRILQAVVYSR